MAIASVELKYPVERDTLFLRYDEGTIKLAYDVLKDGYIGGGVMNTRNLSRSLYDARILASGGLAHGWRDWAGVIVCTAANDEGLTREALDETIELGSTKELVDALLSDDLEVLSPEDTQWWPCTFIGNPTPQMEYDPMGSIMVIQGRLVQRAVVVRMVTT